MNSEENVPARTGKFRLSVGILIAMFIFAVGGIGGYWVGSRRGQSSTISLQTSPKPSLLPSALSGQRLSPAPTISTSQTDPTSDWKTYRSERYGFEFKYPPHLYSKRTLLPYGPFNPGLMGSIVESFSDGKLDEIVISVSPSSIDGYMVTDNPAGVFYTFDAKSGRWVSSFRGRDNTGHGPKLLDTSVVVYGYRSGDGNCSWYSAVAPHMRKNYVVELVFVTCAVDGQKSRFLSTDADITKIINTIRLVD